MISKYWSKLWKATAKRLRKENRDLTRRRMDAAAELDVLRSRLAECEAWARVSSDRS